MDKLSGAAWTYEKGALGEPSFEAGQYNPELMPKFAFGAPTLTAAEQTRVCGLAKFLRPVGDGASTILRECTLLGDMVSDRLQSQDWR